jgi:hypothetical protein
MAFSINLLCLSGHIESGHLDAVRRLAELGYDGVEVPVLSGDPSHYAWLGRELDALGLRRTTTSIIPSPDANPLSADSGIRSRGAAHLDWALDCAVALGAESVGGPFHAPLGHFTGTGPSEDEIRYGADSHRRMAERAAAEGVYLSLEPLNRFETHFLNTMEQARAYVGRVDHPAFASCTTPFTPTSRSGASPAPSRAWPDISAWCISRRTTAASPDGGTSTSRRSSERSAGRVTTAGWWWRPSARASRTWRQPRGSGDRSSRAR